MRFGHVAPDSCPSCCSARKPASICQKDFAFGLRRWTKHSRQLLARSKPSVTAAVSFGSESPSNPMAARSFWNSLGLPELGSLSAHCSKCDEKHRRLRDRGVLRDRWLLRVLGVA